MKAAVLFSVFFLSAAAFAGLDGAKKVAEDYLQAGDLRLEDESARSYFFISQIQGESDEQFPCIYGVVVDKESEKIVDPTSDADINVFMPFSDTTIEGLTVKNCAD